MKAAVYSKNGSPDVFAYTDIDDPAAKADELLVRVEAISVEGGDLLSRRHRQPPHNNYIVGYVAAGEIVGLGSSVNNFAVGQKVVTFNFAGSHAALRAAPAAASFLIPDGMDVALAAAAFVAVGTAVWILHLADLKRGQSLLVTGATGGVANVVCQLAHTRGAYVLATGRNARKLDQMKDYGVDQAIVTGDATIEAQVKATRPKGVDTFVDTLGAGYLMDGLNAVADGGKVILVSGNSTPDTKLDPMVLLGRRLTIIGCYLGPIIADPVVRNLIEEGLIAVAKGEIRVPIDEVFRLSDTAAAHRRAEEGGRFGRIIIRP